MVVFMHCLCYGSLRRPGNHNQNEKQAINSQHFAPFKEGVMSDGDLRGSGRQPIDPLSTEAENQLLGDDWDDWDEFDAGPSPDDLWDAFELDDEITEPQPAYGDFWGELDDEEPI